MGNVVTPGTHVADDSEGRDQCEREQGKGQHTPFVCMGGKPYGDEPKYSKSDGSDRTQCQGGRLPVEGLPHLDGTVAASDAVEEHGEAESEGDIPADGK